MINNKRLSVLSVATLIALASSNAFAANGKITFNGKVVAASCDVATASQTMAVALPSVADSALGTTKGETAGHTSFTISLENCESQTATQEKVRVAFSGTADANEIYVLQNTAATNAATGVGLQLFQPDGVTQIDINNGPNKDKEFTIPAEGAGAKSYDLNYVVAYTNTAGAAVKAGNVEAIANYSIEYN
ncbi:fimbrial protein [Vibrio owensii]|uniref:fimbrial protein n=1 Tax=Vibrio owensii TaxID=696485 RepID=UPI0003A22CC8|nr:fimbrial protein [Vibrio owensii]